jgi:hypothetical protein
MNALLHLEQDDAGRDQSDPPSNTKVYFFQTIVLGAGRPYHPPSVLFQPLLRQRVPFHTSTCFIASIASQLS